MTARLQPGRSGPPTATVPIRPRAITVLYDANCPMCRRARRWVERQRQLIPVNFVAAGSQRARHRFPELDVGSTLADITVVTDRGAVLRGDRAWITVLWAVARTRPTAVKLARGHGRRTFRSVRGATETVRRLSARQPDRRALAVDGPDAWPPPSTGASNDAPCGTCRT